MPEIDYVAETIAAIMAAPDVSHQEWREPITESVSLANGMSRVTREEWTSASVGKTYRKVYHYVNGVDSPAWGAINDIAEGVF